MVRKFILGGLFVFCSFNLLLACGPCQVCLGKKAVIDSKKSQWLNDPKMSGYLRPQTLFQEGKFQGYLMAAKAVNNSNHNLNGKTYESGVL